jgi:hypothetical protein
MREHEKHITGHQILSALSMASLKRSNFMWQFTGPPLKNEGTFCVWRAAAPTRASPRAMSKN